MLETQLDPGQAMVAGLDQWRRSIIDCDDTGLQDQVRDIESVSRILYSVMLGTVAELDSRDIAGTAGFRNTKQLLAGMLNLSPTEAGARVAHATQLAARRTLGGEVLAPLLPHTAAALAAGEIGPGQVRVITEAMAAVPASVPAIDRATADAELAGYARSFTPTSLHHRPAHPRPPRPRRPATPLAYGPTRRPLSPPSPDACRTPHRATHTRNQLKVHYASTQRLSVLVDGSLTDTRSPRRAPPTRLSGRPLLPRSVSSIPSMSLHWCAWSSVQDETRTLRPRRLTALQSGDCITTHLAHVGPLRSDVAGTVARRGTAGRTIASYCKAVGHAVESAPTA